jgi:hypothetical protein
MIFISTAVLLTLTVDLVFRQTCTAVLFTLHIISAIVRTRILEPCTPIQALPVLYCYYVIDAYGRWTDALRYSLLRRHIEVRFIPGRLYPHENNPRYAFYRMLADPTFSANNSKKKMFHVFWQLNIDSPVVHPVAGGRYIKIYLCIIFIIAAPFDIGTRLVLMWYAEH